MISEICNAHVWYEEQRKDLADFLESREWTPISEYFHIERGLQEISLLDSFQ